MRVTKHVSTSPYLGYMTTNERPKIGLLVVDLDDTLWTWFDAWYESFSSMMMELQKATGLSREELLPAIKSMHEQKGTAEYSWLLDELPILEPFRAGRTAREVFDSVLHAQNSARKYNTVLYPGVMSTLRYLKANNVTVVAYTESLSFWTEWRMRTTGLDGLIDVLYSSPDHDFPEGETKETVRTLPNEEYGLKRTIHRGVARGIAKPNPQILKEIVAAHAVAGRSVVYVGDSLDRDVEMAQKVGVLDVHAKYGESYQKPGYDLLRAVTHWKPTEVDKERSNDPNDKVTATYVLDEGFYQLLTLFDFASPINVEAHLQMWREAVGVQMHFNDIGWRIRALALTVLTFTLGAIGYAYINFGPAHIGAWEVSPALFLPFVGTGLWCAFWFADRGWFHKLLVGSVKEGADQEEILSARGVPTNLGGYITNASPIKFKHWKYWWGKRKGKAVEWHSSLKLNFFYGIGLLLLGATAVAIAIYGPRPTPMNMPPEVPVVNNNITIVPPVPSVLPTPPKTPSP